MNRKKVTGRKGFKVLVTVICLVLIMSLITAGNSSVGNLFTGYILVPVQQALSGTARSAEETLTPPAKAEELERENQELKEENKRLNDMLVDYYELKKENEELYKFYDIKKENADFSLLPASVIGRDPNENFYNFTLDKGITDGVRFDDPVMTDGGLIGRVCEVSEKSCKVATILSPAVQVGALDKKSDDIGIISGSGKYCDDGLTVMKNISAQNKMEAGDIVVTSGFGGMYPRNVKIGTISSIETDSYTGTPIAVVEPFEDIREITSAAVVVNFSGKGDIAESSENSKESSDKS